MKGNPLQTLPDLFRQTRHRYVVPTAPEMAWSPAPTKRRSRVGYLVLAGIVLLQAGLSVRLTNSTYQDESLYLYAGHVQLEHWFSGGPPPPENWYKVFSGAPYLYPVLGALFDSVGGLALARFFSLLCMAGVTCVVYSVTNRLFNLRSALFAAAAYAVVESTTYMGNFATYDAPALFLIAVAFWITSRFDRSAEWFVLISVPFFLGLAFAFKYASALFAGPVIALAVVFAWPHLGRQRALLRGGLLAAVSLGLIVAWTFAGGLKDGLMFTTLDRKINTNAPLGEVVGRSVHYAGVFLLIALFGGVMFYLKPRLNEAPTMSSGTAEPGKVWRFFLAAGMFSSGLLVPAYQTYSHVSVALHKHVGFGMLFAAPLVGVGLVRALGAHFSSPQFAIGAWLLLLVPGMQQTEALFNSWPNSSRMIEFLRENFDPDGKYLASTPSNQQYYLGSGKSKPDQWVSTYDINDEYLLPGALKDVRAGKYDMIMIDDQVEPELNRKIIDAINVTPVYRLRVQFYYGRDDLYGNYMIWTKIKP
ncbi:DUF3824 domain-containing protein [Actinocorallia lasiicapitis]